MNLKTIQKSYAFYYFTRCSAFNRSMESVTCSDYRITLPFDCYEMINWINSNPFKEPKMNRSTVPLSVLILINVLCADTADYAVQVHAQVQEDPPQITLIWPWDNAGQYHVFKKSPADTSWGSSLNVLNGHATQYIDSDVALGQAYEYGIYKTLSFFSDTLYVPNGTLLTFIIEDSWGDGMCCHHGLGFYHIEGYNQEYAHGGEFGSYKSERFTVNGGSDTTEDRIVINIQLDVFTQETSWELVDNLSGAVIASAGNYIPPKFGHIYAGINVPEVENRGSVLLIVDSFYSDSLIPEINRLKSDLTGDGWRVIHRTVDRTMAVTAVKSMILDIHDSVSDLNTIFLLGHVPVPYSGNVVSAHADHQGAWPADVYYAEIDDNWTDFLVTNTTANRPANHNVPGDGKFDQTFIRSGVDFQIGRVDLYDMPTFESDETELLRNYLNKDHDFRHGLISAERRGLVEDNVGDLYGLAFAANGLRNFAAMFGPENVHENDYLTTLNTESYMWSYGCGPSGYTGCGGICTTSSFATEPVLTVFTMLYGSYFGDWDNTNNVLRAPLGSPNSALACFWAGAPNWHLHHMAMGETLGYAAKISQNNIALYAPTDKARQIHTALMGDPTLRMHIVEPPTNLQIVLDTSSVHLNWDPPENISLGHHIYRSHSLSEPFSRLTTEPVLFSEYIDDSPSAGNNIYMVRSLKLESSASGTYFNLSQGILDSLVFDLQGIDDSGPDQLAQFSISRIFPNPFNSTTVIRFFIPHLTGVKVSIYNLNGSLIRQIVDTRYTRGEYSVIWDGEDSSGTPVSSGLYLVQIESDEGLLKQSKLTLLR